MFSTSRVTAPWFAGTGIGWQLSIYLLFGAEVLLFTDWFAVGGLLVRPVLFYTSSLLLVGASLGYWLDRPRTVALPAERSLARLPLASVGLLLGGLLTLYAQAPVIAANPIDVRQSDIIPVLQVYVARFRSGEVVYRYLSTLPYPLFPNHLTLHWLPYVPADQLGIDFRWWALGLLLLLGFGAYQLLLLRQPLHLAGFVLKAALPGGLLYFIVSTMPALYSHAVEPGIIAYYCLLAAAVLSRSALLQAAALTLCLLSRYSVALWVPFYLWVLWREVGPRHALLVAGVVTTSILVFYVIPFLSHDWTIFSHALNEYSIGALGEWNRHDDAIGRPWQLFQGFGFAGWFYTYLEGDIASRLTWLQRSHLVLSAGVVGSAAGFYYWLRRRYDYQVLCLLALKLYLATFYAFIQVPYAYLTSLSLFISLFLVLIVGTGQTRQLARRTVSSASASA